MPFHLLTFSLVSCNEPQTPLEPNFDLFMLKNFLGIQKHEDLPAKLKSRSLIEHFGDADDPCLWTGVQCSENGVSQLNWEDPGDKIVFQNLERFDPAWLPSALERAQLSGQYSTKVFEVRFLPPIIEHIEMDRCGLKGTVDTKALPRRLISFILSRNELHGKILLMKLPTSLQRVELHQNSFSSLTVDNDSIPENIVAWKFHGQSVPLKVKVVNGKKLPDEIWY